MDEKRYKAREQRYSKYIPGWDLHDKRKLSDVNLEGFGIATNKGKRVGGLDAIDMLRDLFYTDDVAAFYIFKYREDLKRWLLDGGLPSVPGLDSGGHWPAVV